MDDEEPAAKKAKLQCSAPAESTPSCDANEVTTFNFLDPLAEPDAIKSEATFRPAMMHQFFGDKEVRTLCIAIHWHPLHLFLLPTSHLFNCLLCSYALTAHHPVTQEINGYEGLAIDLWLSQRSYQALVEVRYEEKLPGADDIVKLLRDKFPSGLSQSRAEFLAALSSTAPLCMDSLGEAVSTRSMEDGSTLAVYRTNLSQAHQTVKVSWRRLLGLHI